MPGIEEGEVQISGVVNKPNTSVVVKTLSYKKKCSEVIARGPVVIVSPHETMTKR